MLHNRFSSVKKLSQSYSRYLFLTVIGSSTLLVSFSWDAETSLLSAAGVAMVIELLLGTRHKKTSSPEKTVLQPIANLDGNHLEPHHD